MFECDGLDDVALSALLSTIFPDTAAAEPMIGAGPEGPEDLNNFMIYPRVLPPYTDTPNHRDAPETHGQEEPLPISIHTCDHSEAVSPKTLAECRTDLHLSTPAAPRPPLISAAEDDDRNPQFAAPSADARVSSAPCSNTRCMASNFAAAFAAEPTSESQTGSVLDHLTALVAPNAPPKQLKASVQPTCVDPVGGRHIHGNLFRDTLLSNRVSLWSLYKKFL